MIDITATLREKHPLAPRVWGFTFDLPPNAGFSFAPGQYVLLKIAGQYRQYSISSPASETQSFELIVEYFEGGLASDFLSNLQPSETAEFKGPAGVFTLKESSKDKIFLATGTGIAPVKSMIDTHFGGMKYKNQENSADHHQLIEKPEFRLYFGVRTWQDMYLYDHFSALAEKYNQFTFDACLSREEDQEHLHRPHVAKGRVNEVMDAWIKSADKNIRDYEFYVCGSDQAAESLKTFLVDCGAEKMCIYFERFS